MSGSWSVIPLRGSGLHGQVVEVDGICWSEPHLSTWVLGEFLAARGSHAVVAVDEDQEVLGYLLYTVADTVVTLRRAGVVASRRRQGIGRSLIEAAVTRRKRPVDGCVATVSEYWVIAQLWLRGCGFRTFGRSSICDETGHDLYQFLRMEK